MEVAARSFAGVLPAAALHRSSTCQCKKTSMEIRWARRRKQGTNSQTRSTVPIYISTNPSHVDPQQLRRLFSLCNHSCHRFPKVVDAVAVEAVDLEKLRIALSHSFVLVSVFCNPRNVGIREEEEDGLGDLLQRLIPPALMISPSNGKLVGFGRAVTDVGLTASIHDVVVVPELQGMGIGKMIVQKILRILTSRDIYDIAALCSANERLFFSACGFGDDMLGSTTMMYTRTVSTCDNGGDQAAKLVGRKPLLIPPLRESLLKVTVAKSAED
ncbi:Uncharacterized N-acetyltransferase ycf52 [Linum perenne]